MSVVALICVIFFFCKQKTAYEMRISDWRSDVCSSDLPVGDGVQLLDDQWHHLADLVRSGAGVHAEGTVIEIGRGEGVDRIRQAALQIGRASSRERVCQCV